MIRIKYDVFKQLGSLSFGLICKFILLFFLGVVVLFWKLTCQLKQVCIHLRSPFPSFSTGISREESWALCWRWAGDLGSWHNTQGSPSVFWHGTLRAWFPCMSRGWVQSPFQPDNVQLFVPLSTRGTRCTPWGTSPCSASQVSALDAESGGGLDF